MESAESILNSEAEAIVYNVDMSVFSEDGMQFDPLTMITILATLLPMLFNMPCFSGESPLARQKRLERNPNLARIILQSKARSLSKKYFNGGWTKKQSFAIADASVEHLVSLGSGAVSRFCGACAQISN